MEIAALNGLLMVGVIVASIAVVRSPAQRRVVITLAAVPLACSILALVVLALPFDLATVEWGGVAFRIGAMCAAVGILYAVRLVLRSTGSTRFAWRRGTYAQYTIREEFNNERK
jgi:1,4-dihydroxy-2-naphthoate octaprenyltransferase